MYNSYALSSKQMCLLYLHFADLITEKGYSYVNASWEQRTADLEGGTSLSPRRLPMIQTSGSSEINTSDSRPLAHTIIILCKAILAV